MKHCPSCKQIYGDDVRFCYADGTSLVGGAAEQPGERPTAMPIDGAQSPPYVSKVKTLELPSTTNIALIGMAFFAILAAGAIILWMLSISNATRNAADTGQTNTPTPSQTRGNERRLPTPNARNDNIPANRDSYQMTPTAQTENQEQTRGKVLDTIDAWKQAGESRDIDDYMAFYGDVIDYYRKPESSKSFVRGDKQRAFTKFQTATVNITDLNVSLGADGESAEALFDKEWLYDGRTRFSGKVRQRLRLRRIDDRWLIFGERDIKVYYVNK